LYKYNDDKGQPQGIARTPKCNGHNDDKGQPQGIAPATKQIFPLHLIH
jgi:hypothetical protein